MSEHGCPSPTISAAPSQNSSALIVNNAPVRCDVGQAVQVTTKKGRAARKPPSLSNLFVRWDDGTKTAGTWYFQHGRKNPTKMSTGVRWPADHGKTAENVHGQIVSLQECFRDRKLDEMKQLRTTGNVARVELTLEQGFALYAQHKVTNRDWSKIKTAKKYEGSHRAVMGHFKPHRLISSITLADWSAYMKSRTNAAYSYNQEAGQLAEMGKYVAKWHNAVPLAFDPAAEDCKMKETKNRKPHLSPADAVALLSDITDQHYQWLIKFYLLTGIREMNVLQLEAKDIKDGCACMYVKDKSEAGGRYVELRLNRWALALLETIGRDVGTIFTNNRGGKRWWLNKDKIPQNSVNQTFGEIVKRLGLDSALTIHSLRHTFATWQAMGGANEYRLMEMLCHTSASSTMHYVKLNPKNTGVPFDIDATLQAVLDAPLRGRGKTLETPRLTHAA